jgi:hypothetical protein
MDNQPDKLASDMEAMQPYWSKINALYGGLTSMRANSDTFLPKMPDESSERYELRKGITKLTNVFRDIVENLSQRAFAKKVTLAEDSVDAAFKEFEMDVDGRGNSLHVVAGEMFYDAIGYSIDWMLVDYTKGVPLNATVADEKKLGARPYWVRYPVTSVLAAYTSMIEGKEHFTHVRLKENSTKRVGFGEETVKRVRQIDRAEIAPGVFDNPMVTIFLEHTKESGEKEWVIEGTPYYMTIKYIPLVPFVTGRRKGKGWKTTPAMQDAADLQITLYQQESALEFAKLMTAFPMLAGNGVSPMIGADGNPEPISAGPGLALYAPSSGDGAAGSWTIIEPSSSSLTFLASDVSATIKELREIGRQPLTAQSGNLTRITTAFAAGKGNSAVQAWALNAKDALELALYYTALWLKSDAEPKVVMDLDFDVSEREDDGYSNVLELRKEGEISRHQTLHEAKRRGILDKDFDPDDDLDMLLEEIEGDKDNEGKDDDVKDDDDPLNEDPDALKDPPPGG